ncbi:MAG: CoA transferase [Deltaproteobacteria bacterium]|nr:CoA transferase [Deltaproteobacteria bacterium]
MLSPYRVLDLTRSRGHLCGQILGDLGADVVQVEPPGGAPTRRRGPYVDDVPHPDRSLEWWAVSRNKRGVTLDLERARGRELLRRMVATADFLIESETPGIQAARGLDYDALAAVNPRLVYVSITPFGQTGPKATWADSDLVLLAAGGPLRLAGDEDRAPLRVGVPQAYAHAAAEAAGAALVAHHERARSGRGQHVDVSAQQAVTLATQSYLLSSAIGFPDARRISGGVGMGPLSVRFVHPASDGHVSITFLFGSSVGPFTRRLMHWIADEGGCDAATRDKDWIRFFDQMFSGEESFAEVVRVQALVAAFTRTKTKAELLRAAVERDLLIAPVATTREVVESAQLAARDYWRELDHPELGRTVRYPGPFARASATPLRHRRRPPTVGEHNREILGGELGLDDADLARLAAEGVI